MDILINDLLRIFNYNVTVDTLWDQQQAKERITSKSPNKMIQEEKQEVVANLWPSELKEEPISYDLDF
jgi:hypothetical protein